MSELYDRSGHLRLRSLLTTDALFAMCYPDASKVPAAVCQNGVMDYIYHPIEPLAFRLTLAGPLETIGTINIPAMAAEMKRSFPAAPMQAGGLRLDQASMSALTSATPWSATSGSTVDTCDRRHVGADLRQRRRIGTAAFRSATTT